MKKIFSFLLVAVLCASLVACSSGGVKSTVPEIATAVEAASGLVNPIAINEDDIYYTMALTPENIDTYAGSRSNTNGASGTVLVLKAKSGKAADLKSQLEAYKTTNADFLATYPEFATSQQQAKDGRIVVNGDFIVFAIGGPEADYAAIDTAITDALK